MKAERVQASRQLASASTGAIPGDRQGLVAAVADALFAATICSYAQGFGLLRTASAEYDWHVDLREIARIWTGGCIIRARLLEAACSKLLRSPILPQAHGREPRDVSRHLLEMSPSQLVHMS